MSIAFLHRDMAADEARDIELYGYVRDISASGMGIIIPAMSFDTRTCADRLPLQLTLEPAKGSVEVQAESVHCAPLDLRVPLEGAVIGAKLSQLSDQARATVAAHLRRSPEA